MDMTMFRRRGLLLNTPHIVNESGSIITFDSAYNKVPIKSLVCNIEPIQSGSGDPSPENVRPISGRTGLSVVRCGKNLITAVDGTYANSATTQLVCSNGNYTLENISQYQLGVTSLMSVVGIVAAFGSGRFIKPGTYTFSANVIKLVGTTSLTNIRMEIKNLLTGSTSVKQSGSSFTITDEHEIISFPATFGGFPVGAKVTCSLQLETGSSATPFEKYIAQTIPVTWQTEAGTVYGGYVDVVSGKLTVDRAMVDLGELNWEYATSFDAYCSVGLAVKANTAMLCSTYPYVGSYVNLVDKSIANIYNTRVGIRDSSYQDATTFKAAMSGIMLVYEIVMPITYQLNPQQVKTLLGENNIWCDSGDVSIDYWKWGN